jgi:predicted kinase
MRTLSLSKPHLIVMVGIPGSGKSFFAEQFAETFNAPLVSLEKIGKDLFETTHFSEEEQLITEKIASYMLLELFKTSQSIVFDGDSTQRNDRALLTKFAQTAGYETLFVWIQTEPISAKLRATKGKGVDGLTSDEFNAAYKRFSAPHELEKAVVVSGKHTYPSQLKNVLKRLVQPRTQASTQLTIEKRIPQNGRNILIR